jgi:type I restriction-modification system DNA methylase subunit
MNDALFEDNNPLANRQRKTDRLILPRFLEVASKDERLEADAIRAHAILIRWAELETAGKLEKLKETQLQGDFLAQVFGEALGYRLPTGGDATWTLEQHQVVGSQTPDAVLGKFGPGAEPKISAVVELKGARTHLDHGRSNARTPVDQCWDYLVNLPTTCRWGVVSNFVSFRLYERSSTKRRYEHFTLQSLRNFDIFRQFYTLLSYEGLVQSRFFEKPRAVGLLEETNQRQRTVGDELYGTYSQQRINLIQELHLEKKHPLPDAIEWAQRLFDRVFFIAFCEDRGLLPEKTLETAWDVKGFHAVTNPRWQSYKTLFRMIDAGGPPKSGIPAYNGGLFAKSPVDDLDLDDDRYTSFFKNLGTYDFADEVNLDVLGHLFERSITEVEKLKESGFFGGDAEKAQAFARMPQSAKRKRLGIYYTPPELTSRIVQYTVEELIQERFKAIAGDPTSPEVARARLDVLRRLKIVDPACGSGAFLFQAYDLLDNYYEDVLAHLPDAERKQHARQVPAYILNDNLYGVDLSPEAVEITQLALWIRSADRTQKLAKLSHNIVHGNSLVADAAVDPFAFDWQKRFPEVFEREEKGFDCVIGNPPWERIKLQEREFFSLPAPEIATATDAAKRRRLVEKLESDDPALYDRYIEAQNTAQSLIDYCRKSGAFPLCGRGDINTHAVFAELASKLVSKHGRVGILVPSGIASDSTTKDFFGMIAENNRLIRLYDFENKGIFFPEVHPSFRFCILNFGGEGVQHKAADFVFFAHSVEELESKKRHVELSGDDIKLLNPNTRTCPVFFSRRDAKINLELISKP